MILLTKNYKIMALLGKGRMSDTNANLDIGYLISQLD